MVDARLPDGSRVNIAVRPIAIDGPLVSIRKFSERAFNMTRLVEVGTIHAPIVELLTAAVHGRISLHTPINADNRRYLTAKATRAGHRLDHIVSALGDGGDDEVDGLGAKRAP